MSFDFRYKKPVPRPNCPPGYRWLTNTRATTLHEYLNQAKSCEFQQVINTFYSYQVEDLIILDEAYDIYGVFQPNLKAVFVRENAKNTQES